MKYSFFPGCTLHNQSLSFRDSTLLSARALNIEIEELKDWYCCGAVFPLRNEDTMSLLAPTRNLIAAKKEGNDLITLCSACFQVLKRTNFLLQNDTDKREKINDFLEEKYDGSIRVLHLLEVIREDIGWDELKSRIKKPLTGLKVAPYYGCLLLRPKKELDFDNPENPIIFEDFLQSLHCTPVDFSYKTECCGAYLSITDNKVMDNSVSNIVNSAVKKGAEIIVTSCPLCLYNLEAGQLRLIATGNLAKPIPVVYFTQLLAVALGLGEGVCHFEEQQINPEILKEYIK